MQLEQEQKQEPRGKATKNCLITNILQLKEFLENNCRTKRNHRHKHFGTLVGSKNGQVGKGWQGKIAHNQTKQTKFCGS